MRKHLWLIIAGVVLIVWGMVPGLDERGSTAALLRGACIISFALVTAATMLRGALRWLHR